MTIKQVSPLGQGAKAGVMLGAMAADWGLRCGTLWQMQYWRAARRPLDAAIAVFGRGQGGQPLDYWARGVEWYRDAAVDQIQVWVLSGDEAVWWRRQWHESVFGKGPTLPGDRDWSTSRWSETDAAEELERTRQAVNEVLESMKQNANTATETVVDAAMAATETAFDTTAAATETAFDTTAAATETVVDAAMAATETAATDITDTAVEAADLAAFDGGDARDGGLSEGDTGLPPAPVGDGQVWTGEQVGVNPVSGDDTPPQFVQGQ